MRAAEPIHPWVQGVLNGIDTHLWDPARDPLLPAPFSSSQPQGKALCKRWGARPLYGPAKSSHTFKHCNFPEFPVKQD